MYRYQEPQQDQTLAVSLAEKDVSKGKGKGK
jgi:hypothetical protein